MSDLDLTRDPSDSGNSREDLINKLITQSMWLEQLWQFHPDNPNKIDVVAEYKQTQNHINLLTNIIGPE